LTPLVGLALGSLEGAGGWQLMWTGSLLLGLVASAFLLRMPTRSSKRFESNVKAVKGGAPTASSLRHGLADVTLRRFVATSGLFQFSVMLAGPFFAVYLVQQLGASPVWIGLTAAASPLSAALSQAFVGRLADSIGPRRLLVAGNAVIMLTPLMWLLAAEPWHVVVINLIGGSAWQASLAASFNLLVEIAPPSRLPSYTAFHQTGQFAVTFAGPLAGGFLIGVSGFDAVFLLSAIGRLVATGLQVALVLEEPAPRPKAALPNLRASQLK
jgi:MFS family permease